MLGQDHARLVHDTYCSCTYTTLTEQASQRRDEEIKGNPGQKKTFERNTTKKSETPEKSETSENETPKSETSKHETPINE